MEKVTKKIIAVAGNKKVLKVEDDDNWWILEEPVITLDKKGDVVSISPDIKAGAVAEFEINIKQLQGKDRIYASKVEVQKEEKKEEKVEEKEEKPKYQASSNTSSDKTVSIVRQATLKAAGAFLAGLAGQDLNNVELAAEKVVEVAKRFQIYVDTGE